MSTPPTPKEIADAMIAYAEKIYQLTGGKREPTGRECLAAMRAALIAANALRDNKQ